MRLSLFVLLLLFGVGHAEESPREQVRSLETHMRKIIDDAEPSVVSIVVSHSRKYRPLPAPDRQIPGRLGDYTPPPESRGPFMAPKVDRSLDLSDPENIADNQFGSGLVLSEAGLILTNYHLIEGATKIYIRGASGEGSYADIHAADARSDLAVLKLLRPIAELKPVSFADVRVYPGPKGEKPTVARGMWVISMGHPLAVGFVDGQPSASWGILSNVRRRAAGPAREESRTRALHHYGVLLQTDARITLGCSGGGLFNMDGELIGMTASLAAITGAETAGGFAIPFNPNYRRIIAKLMEGKEVEYGFLGVSVDPLLAARTTKGLPIARVSPGTPAAEAGLLGGSGFVGGDIITRIDGKPVRDTDDLFLHIGSALAGEKLAITVERKGEPLTKPVKLAKFYHTLPSIASVPPETVFGLRVDYTSVLLLQDRGTIDQGFPHGVLIREVLPNSIAAEKMKDLGEVAGRWIITHVNGRSINSPDEFFAEIRKAKPTKTNPVSLRLLDTQPNATTTPTIQLP